MLHRFSSRRASLYEEFLKPRLTAATRYDRIAGYFQSSLLELARDSLADIPRIRIVCNTEVSAEDVKTVRMATELFGFWDHQKYFINLAFQEHLKYRHDAQRGARFLLCDGVGLGKAQHHRVKAGEFIKTLLQRRVGGSLVAGLKTTDQMLAGKHPDEDEDPDEEGDSIYPLTAAEKALLQRLRDHLATHLEREDDPKFERVREVLNLEFGGQQWVERGVLIFSRFYDSAYA